MPLIVAEEHVENFSPLSLTRATFELRFGALAPIERALKITPDVALRARPEIAPYLRAKYGLPVNEDRDGELFSSLPFDAPWKILACSDQLVDADFEEWNNAHVNHRSTGVMNGAHIVGKARDVHLGLEASVHPGCVLDAANGPIIIGAGATVKWSQIQGPVFIGPGCIVDGARLRPGVSLGPHCKVGGEISATIFQSRVNKAHDGFVGNTWAGRWVNFGAGATTSNMKNTYGSIRFSRDLENVVDTGVQFLGSLIGDHAKIGILQGLTTGSHIGVGCNVFGGSVAPKYIPSYSWGGNGSWQQYRLDDFLKTVRAVLARRQSKLRAESEDILRHVFEDSAAVRNAFLISP